MSHRTLIMVCVALALVGAGAFLVLRDRPEPAAELARADAPAATGAAAADMVVYKSPTCGCCNAWVDHVRQAGFTVETVDLEQYDELVDRKTEHGVPEDLGSCHTARVGDYFVEGHVPAELVRRMLDERPDILGLAVPGMPIGSPGMEGPDPQPYDVIAVGRDGSRRVYESVYPGGPASETR